METWNEIDEWIDQYIQGDLSGADRAELIKWLEASPEHAKQFRKILQAEMRVSAAGKWQRLDQVQERVWKRITLTLEAHITSLCCFFYCDFPCPPVFVHLIKVFWNW